MAEKLYVGSVANITCFDETEAVVLTGRSLVDSSIKTAVSELEIRGGKGNPLIGKIFHSSKLDISILNPLWDLNYIAKAVGSTLVTGANVYYEENITLGGGGAGTVTYTPLAPSGSTVCGWVTLKDGVTIEKVTFSTKSFTCSGAENDVVCVKYFRLDNAAKSITIYSKIVPSVLKVVMEVDLFSNSDSSNIIGSVQIVCPSVIMSGVAEINMKADGASQTPLSGSALAFSPPANSGCDSREVFAYIHQIRTSANWYDDATMIGVVGGDFAITHPGTKQLIVKAVHSDGSVSTCPNADLTFSSSDTGKATVTANGGLVSSVATGTSNIHVTVTAKTSLDAYAVVTVS